MWTGVMAHESIDKRAYETDCNQREYDSSEIGAEPQHEEGVTNVNTPIGILT